MGVYLAVKPLQDVGGVLLRSITSHFMLCGAAALIKVEGCNNCLECGYSKCG
jgi:hypothetical protein